MRIGDSMVEQTVPSYPKDAYQRIVGMINIRKQLRNLLNLQNEGCSDEKLQTEQWVLGSQYDIFVKKYGIINSQTNIRLFKDDADSSLLRSCENLSDDKKKATKADIFFKRTIRSYVVATSTDDCFEALQISKNEHGKVDIAYIEELTKKDYDTVINELGTAVFRNPVIVNPEDKYSGFETAEEYLSGKVVKKLETAKEYARDYPDMGYEKNVVALGQVQPEKINASDISIRVGTSWVDSNYYKQFLYELLAIPKYYKDGISIYYNIHDSSWRVDKSSYLNNFSYMNVHEVYGTKRASAYRLFEDCLNLRSTAIYDTVEEDGRERRVLNQIETIAAREKQNEIKEKFREWIFATPERRDDLEATYNSKFNQIRLPSYDGSYLKFPEMNPAVELRPHQKNAVHRIITSGNTLLHHVVGSGKTYTICATIMKLKQYGLAKKSLIAVPNHLTEQWANSFRYLYPNSNILVTQKEDLDKEHREMFVSRVALGDWDAVIMAQSSFAKIHISTERQIRKINEEIARIEETIEYQRFNSNHPTGSVKNLERIKKNREAQLNKLLDDSKKDDVLIFENLGVDYLFIDEAHYYKNKFLFTKMNNVSGISNAASQRASDLELKVEYINELHGGDKGVVFATGTPISNSMTEMYTMQSYLQKRTLEDVGINFFDNWASSFGETIQSLELAPSGQGYKAKTRFAKFVNLPELLTMYRSFADVQTADMVKLDVPEAERKIVNLKPSDAVLELAEEIAERAERIHDGSVDPHEDNMLKVTSDGKKLALDPRCMDRFAPDEEGSKINACAQNCYEEWLESKNIRGTQLVFCDLSTPKKSYEEYEYGKDFDVYNDLKYKLVQKGIPEEEIAFIHDAKNDKQKQALFDKVNSGSVRILIGSTEKCGAGTNVQERLVALHHLDTPYRPSDMEQRNGRGIRQGNINKNIRIYTYVKERTFDSYSYQILENKQRFISQIDRGDLTVREADDIDETTLSYAEIKAITSANPKIKRKMEVDSEIQRLRVLESQYRKSLYSIQDKVRKYYPEEIQRQTSYLERLRKDIETVKEKFNPDEFKINVLGTEFTDKKLGGQALLNALHSYKTDTIVAEYAGLKISLNPLVLLDAERSVSLIGSGRYSMSIGDSATGLLTRLDNFMTDFPLREEKTVTKLEQLKKDLEVAKEQEKKPFEHAEKLAELLKEQAELNAELDLNRKEEVVISEENDEEEVASKMVESETKGFRQSKAKPRKILTKAQENMYNIQLEKAPDSYVFIKNGSYYDIYGEKAKELAEKYSKETIEENGKTVVSFDFDELDTVIREVVDGGSQARIIETPSLEKEVEFIQEEDRIAQMQVPILPCYSVTQEFMHEKGYTWDGMLPLTRKTARTLNRMGLQIFKLNEDGSESEVKDENDFNSHQSLYGIEKPVWNDFLDSSEGKNYVAARLAMCDSASSVINEELSYVDEKYTINFNNVNYEERKSLSSYISGKDVDVEEMRKNVPALLSEFTDRIYDDVLEYYGWAKNDVASAIADNLQPDELLEEANKEVDRWNLREYLYDGIYKYHVADLMKGKSIGELDDNDAADSVLVELKEHFENTEWSEGFEDVAYDEWYDEFSEYTLKPILMGKNYNKAEEIILNEMENMSDKEALDFLDINVKYKEKVIERIEKEHE
ncbi:MAG: DEAD/DEAH box helicase family protein [Clostridia bacterium]|nr:DEAD/DEAH box helicase family protein [Clostridia bacterium]